MALPKLNYCDFRRGTIHSFSFFETFLEGFYKYGNLTKPCPFKKGYYYMRDVLIDDSRLPMIFKMKYRKVLVQVITADESTARTKAWLATTDFYVILTN
jgi:Protein of unknown function (DUF1091)